jgi:DNA-3-methyladenine glycosylase I
VAYHDTEWGVPVHDDRMLFEMLCLEGAQAGLSWLTILRKRDGYRRAFDGFDAAKMSRYDAAKRRRLMGDAGIVRNRLKIGAFIDNAKAYLEICRQPGDFDAYLWAFTRGRVQRRRPGAGQVRTSSKVSDVMSRDLKRRGFRFIGSTICYAFMQAVGMVDEHQRRCWVSRRGSVR